MCHGDGHSFGGNDTQPPTVVVNTIYVCNSVCHDVRPSLVDLCALYGIPNRLTCGTCTWNSGIYSLSNSVRDAEPRKPIMATTKRSHDTRMVRISSPMYDRTTSFLVSTVTGEYQRRLRWNVLHSSSCRVRDVESVLPVYIAYTER